MNIAIIGYGKMGKTIESIALKRNHHCQIITRTTKLSSIEKPDVAIEFSEPEAAFQNIKNMLTMSVPVVCGTTGWLKDLEHAKKLALQNASAFLYASNFSLGVNLFFELNKFLAVKIKQLDYQVSIEEIHHTQKLDKPSGTAISLAEQIIENSNYTDWTLEQSKSNAISIHALREADVKGTHSITWKNDIDAISIKHEAFSREGFALGAVLAAEWIASKQGIFTMKDVLEL
ncbi:MAG: 4-hydroxy-tetrahydrodipicolinate reductase [Flavobacteriaceae bacterium]|nr:4-hydroxy-tetrahydrodipicolinate reductase [Flavobacteriaceae bacterium]